MQAVAILIANPAHPILTQEVAEQLGGPVDWLAPGIACERAVDCDDPQALANQLAAQLGTLALDVAVLPAHDRRKQLIVADMDSTIITVECLDELADQVGLKAHIAAITERSMRGELDFETALRERVGLLAGLDQAALARTYDSRVQLTPGAGTLIQTMKAHGAYAALVSGGFTYFTSRVADTAGFDENHANILEIADGQLTGTVREPILGREAKLAILKELAQRRKLDLGQCLAVGDGANDLAMIKQAGLGVAFHAKPIVAAEARARISHGDLTALLYLQGYRISDFVSA